jgi:hypothetical protein
VRGENVWKREGRRLVFAAPIAAAVGIGASATASADLLGDTVSFDGASTVITGAGAELKVFVPNAGTVTADLTSDTLTLTIDHQVGGGTFAIGEHPFIFDFENSTIAALNFISGTVQPLAPTTPLNPCPPSSDPNLICSGEVSFIPPLSFVDTKILDPHSIEIDVSALSLTPDTVTFQIDTAVPEPTTLSLLLASVVGLGALGRRERA